MSKSGPKVVDSKQSVAALLQLFIGLQATTAKQAKQAKDIDMKYKKSVVAVLVIMACFIGVVATADNARAWTWTGFSNLCVDDTFRGPEGWIKFYLEQATVITQCYNTNTYNLDQPGIGNGGDWRFDWTFQTASTKDKGIVSLDGCINMGIFDDHDYVAEGPDGVIGTDDDIMHIHTCQPETNVNKVEVEGTAWVSSFVVHWELFSVDPNENPDATPKNTGTDMCEWNGDFVEYSKTLADGTVVTYMGPEHGVPFECTSTSDKKINFYTEK